MSDRAPDPSMEEILASIKRVITADTDAVRRPRAIPVADEDVLELGEAPAAGDARPLLSGRTEQASKAALAALAGLTIDPKADANTLDGLVREMLRPMLKAWLDDHLPEIVERIVAREVARVVGR